MGDFSLISTLPIDQSALLPLPAPFSHLLRVFQALDTVVGLLKKRGRVGASSLRAAGGAGTSGVMAEAHGVPLITLPLVRAGVEQATGCAFAPELLARALAVAPAFVVRCVRVNGKGETVSLGRAGGEYELALDMNMAWPEGGSGGGKPPSAAARRAAFAHALLRIVDAAHAEFLRNAGAPPLVATATLALLQQQLRGEKRARKEEGEGGAEGAPAAAAAAAAAAVVAARPAWHAGFPLAEVALPPPVQLPSAVTPPPHPAAAAVVVAEEAAAAAGASGGGGRSSCGADAVPPPSAEAIAAAEDAAIAQLLQKTPTLRGMKRESLLGIVRSCGGGGDSGGSGGDGAMAPSLSGAETDPRRLAAAAPRVLAAIVGVLRSPPPLQSRMFLEVLCRRVAAHVSTASALPTSERQVAALVEVLAGTIAPDWCSLVELREDAGGTAGTGAGGVSAGGASGTSATQRERLRRRVFKLSDAAVAALMGGEGLAAVAAAAAGGVGGAGPLQRQAAPAQAGLPLAEVRQRVAAWAQRQK